MRCRRCSGPCPPPGAGPRVAACCARSNRRCRSCLVVRAGGRRPPRSHRRWPDSRCSGSSCRTGPRGWPSGSVCRALSNSAAVTSIPGVQYPHCSALRATNSRCSSAIALRRRQPLDGLDIGAVSLDSQHQAAPCRASVDHDVARAAEPMFAADMGSSEPQRVAQKVSQMQAGLDTWR